MTLILPSETNENTGAVLETVTRQFAIASERFTDATEKLLRGELEQPAKYNEAVADFRKAALNLTTERLALETRRRKADGIVHDYAVDFDAARVEIRRRMACLRGASEG